MAYYMASVSWGKDSLAMLLRLINENKPLDEVVFFEAWGFKYKSIGFQWVKQNRSGNGYFFGLGRWTRGNTEPCLIAVKGKPHRASNSVSQLIFAPLRAHSQKPDITRDKIRELMGGDHSYIELFARNTTPGWDVWGNEVNKYGN